MASGGNNGSTNSGANSCMPNARDWNYTNTAKDSDQWNYPRYHMPNNLTAQERDISRDHYGKGKNKGRCNTSKNNDLHYPQERVSDKEENYSLDQLNSNSFKRSLPSRSMAFPRTKFTTSSSAGQAAVNGVQKKNPKFEEEIPNHNKIKGDGDRNGLNLIGGQKRPQLVEGNNVQISKNMQPNTDSGLEIKENLGKMVNSNEIFGRLVQIRDYIKQINTMIDTLQRTGEPKVAKRIQKLQKVLSDLYHSEQQLTQLLGTIMEMNTENNRRPEENNSDIASDESPDEFEKTQTLLQSAASNLPLTFKSDERNKDKTNELLSKITEYQERLKMLQNQQAALVDLQQKAENKLAESRAFHNQLTLQCEGNNDEVSPLHPQISANRVQDDIDNLQQRINALKYMHEAALSEDSGDGEFKNGEGPENLLELQRQELQNKLRDVQDKKSQLDQLLHELSSIRDSRAQQLMKNESCSEVLKENSNPSISGKYTLEAANELLDSLDASEKYKKLKEMKSKLHQLQEMVADYQAGAEACLENAVINGVQSPPSSLTALNIECRKDNVPQKRLKPQKKDNISREHSNEYLSRGFYEHNQHANERDLPNENSRLSTNKKSLEDDFQSQEKRNKLQSTRAKISTLQKLLEALQDSQVEGTININSTEEMLDELQDDSNPAQLYELADKESHSRIVSDIGNKTQEFNGDDRRKNIGEMSEQKAELENSLIDEEQKLRHRSDFAKLKQHYHDDNEVSASVCRSNASAQVEPSVRVKDKARSRSVTPQKSNKQKSQQKRDVLPSCEKNSIQNILPPAKISPEDINEDYSDFLFSNQEIWSEMRQRLILREELHQKRRELEELMKKDHGKTNSRNQDNMSDNVSYSNKSEGLGMSFVGTEGTTAATWGGSTQGNPEDDQDDHNDSQEEMEEIEDNEAYSSEGIGPVGDEVPSNRGNNLYPDYRNGEQCIKMPSCKIRTNSNNSVPTENKKLKPNFKDMRNIWSKSLPHTSNHSWNSHQTQQPRQNVDAENQEERREPEEPNVLNSDRNNIFWTQQATYLQQQLDQVNGIRQAIMRDQQNFSNQLQQSNLNASSGSSPPEMLRPSPYFPEIHQQYSQQLQQQQLFINLNQCCHLLYLQTLEIQQLQHQLQQVIRLHNSGYNYSSNEVIHQPSPNASRSADKPVVQNADPASLPPMFPRSHISAPSFPGCSSSGHTVIRSESFPCTLSNQQETRPETLNNQVAPGMRANNYWDNFRSYSRQNLLSTASVNKSNGSSRNLILSNSDNPASLSMQGNHPPHHEPCSGPSLLGIENTQMASNFQNIPVDDEMQTSFLQFGSDYNSSRLQVPKLDLGNFLNKPKERKPVVNQEQQKLEQKISPRCLAVGSSISPGDAFKSGENCGMNGPAYLTNTSSSSAASLGSSAREMVFGTGYQDCRTNNMEPEEANDRSLFDSLRESIYTEVGALISQNECRPHFLIQLFTELQQLNSDDLRQTALVAIHDLVSQVFSHNSSPSIRRPVKTCQTWNETSRKASGEPTANECFMTSDDEEIRSQLFKMNKPFRKSELAAIKRPQNRTNRQCDVMNDNKNFEKSLTIPLSMEQEFADDNSSDLVLQSNKTMNQPKTSLEMALEKSGPNQCGLARSYHPAMEVTGNGTSDHNSEPSNSDQSATGLNANKLDDQIQQIMLEIIPFLKAHLDDACSSKLLSYVCQLTLSVASELEEAMELNQFFRKQLSSLLYETLMKYKGKRLRDCGEDLLVDMSEVLFNELAFLRLVQNMDNSVVTKFKTADDNSQGRFCAKNEDASKNKQDVIEQKNQSKDVNSLLESCVQQTLEMREMEATDADLTLHRADEEDLGQSRDDAMAATCDIFDNEDASRASSTNSVPSTASMQIDTSDEHRKLIPKRTLPKEESQLTASTSADANKEEEFNLREADRETEAEGLEDNQDLAEADQLQNQPIASNASGTAENLLDTVSQCSEEFIRAEATEDDQVQRQEENEASAANKELVDGAAASEHGLDEIPIKLCSVLEDDLVLRRQEEEMHNSIIQEILRDAVESELDEDIIPIREPDTK